MTQNKTQATNVSAEEYISHISDAAKRTDAKELLMLMEKLTGEKPVMWGPSIIGFGTYHYVYDSGREGDMPAVAFAPRKKEIVLYGLLGNGLDDKLTSLGKHKLGKGCLYLTRLSDADEYILSELIVAAYNAKNAK